MSLIAGNYSPNFCCGMIHKQEKRQFQHSHIDPDSIYLSDVALVRRMEGPMHHQDALSEYYNVDALWGFVIGAAHDIRECVARHRLGEFITGDAILHRLMMMGTYKWIAEDVFQQGNFPSMAFRYSSILSNCLLKRIERMENLVGRW